MVEPMRRGLVTIASVGIVALLAAGCTSSPTPSPDASPVATATPSMPAFRDEFRYGVSRRADGSPYASVPYGGIVPAGDGWGQLATWFTYDGLYAIDRRGELHLDLAAKPCEVADDQVTITCTIKPGVKAHDGMTLTSEDVAFSVELGNPDRLASVSTPDKQTVIFELKQPYGPFTWSTLMLSLIDLKHVVESDAAAVSARVTDADLAAIRRHVAVMEAPEASSNGDCTGVLATAEGLIDSAGLLRPDRSEYTTPDGAPDTCRYAVRLHDTLTAMVAAFGADGLDRIRAIYPYLPYHLRPIATGPYRFSSYDPESGLVLEAFDGYHLGTASTRQVVLRPYADTDAAAAALERGEVDRVDLPRAYSGSAEQRLGRNPGIAVHDQVWVPITMLVFNVRPDRPFADGRLRRAFATCIDKKSAVEAAVGVFNTPVEADVRPNEWAFNGNLRPRTRDVEAAKALIESAGWRRDGAAPYRKGGQSLSFTVFVRDDAQDRVRFVREVAEQVAECGIEVTVRSATFDEIDASVRTYPNHQPASDEPFDITYLTYTCDRSVECEFATDFNLLTSMIPSEQDLRAWNYGGFSDPRIDALNEEGRRTYDVGAATAISRQIQAIEAEDLPVYAGYFEHYAIALSNDVELPGGRIDDLDPYPMWFFAPTLARFVVRDSSPEP